MDTRVFCYYFLIWLLCAQLYSTASEADNEPVFSGWIHQCYRMKVSESGETISDFSGIVEFLSPTSTPSSSKSLEISSLGRKELAQLEETFKRDMHGYEFMKYGSPSLKEKIISLAQQATAVARKIGIAAAKEAGNVMDVTSVPMSRSMLEQTMKLSPEKIADIESRTKFFRDEIDAEKRIRLTDDLFGSVCRGANDEALGICMTSPRPNPDITREQKVLDPLEKEINKQIDAAGIFLDIDRGYLAALPDGLVDNDAVVKLYVLNRPRLDANCYKWQKGEDLSPNNPLYYEIQGLLAITRRDICYFIIVSPTFMRHIKVKRDEGFWKKMVDRLDDFYFNILQPRISNNELPNISDIRLAAGILHVVTTEIPNQDLRAITWRTQQGSFDTLNLETRLRLLAHDFYVVMDDNKLIKEKVIEILRNYNERKLKWKYERESKMAFILRYANKYNYDVEMGGLVIDRTNRFLAAFPVAFGYRKVIQSPKEMNGSGVKEKPIRQNSRNGESVQAMQSGNGGKNEEDANGRKGLKGGKALGTMRRTPSRLLKSLSGLESSYPEKRDAIIFEVVTPEELQNLPPDSEVYSAGKGTRNYYKIQGMLAISRAQTCIFMVAYPGEKERVEKIEFDQDVWVEMLGKLKHFYYSAYLIYHANWKEFDRMFRGPSLRDFTAGPSSIEIKG